MSAQILVVKPKTLNAADKKLLREANVVVVESNDPGSVRFLQAEGPALAPNDMFWAAMTAIASDQYTGNTRKKFVANLASLCKVNDANRGATP